MPFLILLPLLIPSEEKSKGSKIKGVGSLFSPHGPPLPARVTHLLHRCAVGDSLALFPGEE